LIAGLISIFFTSAFLEKIEFCVNTSTKHFNNTCIYFMSSAISSKPQKLIDDRVGGNVCSRLVLFDNVEKNLATRWFTPTAVPSF
jgi:hypothetical protein